jgi:DNA-binding GntR family transcriptional regulator
MELVRVDTQRAYEIMWEKITTLELAPGALINEQQLAQELEMGRSPVRESTWPTSTWLTWSNSVRCASR